MGRKKAAPVRACVGLAGVALAGECGIVQRGLRDWKGRRRISCSDARHGFARRTTFAAVVVEARSASHHAQSGAETLAFAGAPSRPQHRDRRGSLRVRSWDVGLSAPPREYEQPYHRIGQVLRASAAPAQPAGRSKLRELSSTATAGCSPEPVAAGPSPRKVQRAITPADSRTLLRISNKPVLSSRSRRPELKAPSWASVGKRSTSAQVRKRKSPHLAESEMVQMAGYIKQVYDLEAMRKGLEKETGVSLGDSELAAAAGMTLQELRVLQRHSARARGAIVASNYGLVANIAKRYFGSVRAWGLSYKDVIQEGSMGLIRAAEKFDPTRGFQFRTYAAWWVRQRVQRAIARDGRTIRLPQHVHDFMRSMHQSSAELLQLLGREPTPEELAKHMKVPPTKLESYANPPTATSIERPAVDLKGRASQDYETDKLAVMVAPSSSEDGVERAMMRDALEKVLSALSEEERWVVVLRYGLYNACKPKTVEEVGKALGGISRDKVRTIETRALNKLRHSHSNLVLRKHLLGREMVP